MSETLKASLVNIAEWRSKDALQGVGISAYQRFTEAATVGPYGRELDSNAVKTFLRDPDNIIVAGSGRNEHMRGNLLANLSYAQEVTGGNVLYADGNSTDGSVELAKSMGVETVRRKDIISPDTIDINGLADILRVQPESLLGNEQKGDPPMRKGLDILSVRLSLLRKEHEGKLPRYVLFTDTDLKSIPGGEVAKKLQEHEVYRPHELNAAAAIDLNKKLSDADYAWAIYTGSENRNNEPIFATYNTFNTDAHDPYLNEGQRQIARALYAFPSTLVHPLTGELLVSASAELSSMGATGQAVESARTISLAGGLLTAYQTARATFLENNAPLTGNVRRGEQKRIDEPQIDDKEWWMINEVLPTFIRVIGSYAIRNEKLPHEFSLDDYRVINEWLKNIRDGSQLDNRRQTRKFDRYPMERAIPPVHLLHQEGIIKAA